MPYPDRPALLQAALDAAANGWHVFPLRPGDKRPAVTEWETRATTDPERIARCWAHAPYNIGLATGPSGLVVVDLDNPKGPEDVPPAEWARPGIHSGYDVFLSLCQEHTGRAELAPDTHTVRTASSGTHLYFAEPEGIELRNTTGKLGWKIDTRAHGGYVVAAGSVLAHGGGYAAVLPVAPSLLPEWLVELLRPAPLPPQKPVTVALASDRRGQWLRAAVNGELQRVTRSGEDQHKSPSTAPPSRSDSSLPGVSWAKPR
ncbi:bifunctional DNA primase/polymerase [Streptomyces sp. SYSU K21746]